MKKTVIAGVLAVVLAVAGIFSTSVAAQPQTFSVAVHISYPSGFEYNGIVARGLSADEKTTMIVECNQSHKWGLGSLIHFLCYAIPE